MFRRTRHQRGSLDRVTRRNSPGVWEFRWYEINSEGHVDFARLQLNVGWSWVLGELKEVKTESIRKASAA